jgi:hypothetical protein
MDDDELSVSPRTILVIVFPVSLSSNSDIETSIKIFHGYRLGQKQDRVGI